MNDKLQVFKEEPGFLKLFGLFKEKYRSLGRIGGSVSIANFSVEEVESIAGFLGQPVETVLGKGKVSLLSFEKELAQTGFADYTLVGLLEAVLGESILTKSEENSIEEEKEKRFFQELKSAVPEGSWWWDWIESKRPDSRWIWSLYKQDPAVLQELLSMVFQAFRALPYRDHKFERLPVFAQRTAGNPHFFDNNQIPGKLLVHCLYVDQQLKGFHESAVPKTAEELNELLSFYGLMRDDLWSFVTCRGLLAEGETGMHPVWQSAFSMDTVLNVPLKELLKLKKIWPAKGNKVWILENSSVCSTIVDEVPEAPVICTHGQFRTASWIVLDLLVESGCQLYYSSDLDPEGLSMAQRLKDRYKEHVTCWRMDAEAYFKTISDEDITSRTTKLDTVTSPELAEVVAALKLHQKAGYQEGILSELIDDIKSEFDKG